MKEVRHTRRLRLPKVVYELAERLGAGDGRTPAEVIGDALIDRWRVASYGPEALLAAAETIRSTPALEAPDIGGVYFVRSNAPTDVAIKIGHSVGSIRHRVMAHRTSHPWPIDLIAYIPGAPKRVESEMHNRFAHLRILDRHEWFRPAPDLLRLVEDLAALVNGGPDTGTP